MKPAPFAFLALVAVAAVAWPLSQLRAAPARDDAAAVQPAACMPEEAGAASEGDLAAPAPHALALPPGHPPVDLRRFLPPGHPPVGGLPGALPPGHPSLPPGHPPVPSSPRGFPLPFGEPVLLET